MKQYGCVSSVLKILGVIAMDQTHFTVQGFWSLGGVGGANIIIIIYIIRGHAEIKRVFYAGLCPPQSNYPVLWLRADIHNKMEIPTKSATVCVDVFSKHSIGKRM